MDSRIAHGNDNTNMCIGKNKEISKRINRSVWLGSSEISYSSEWRAIEVIDGGIPRGLDIKPCCSLLFSLHLKKNYL